jgi:two-component system sensor histidine kinase HydH
MGFNAISPPSDVSDRPEPDAGAHAALEAGGGSQVGERAPDLRAVRPSAVSLRVVLLAWVPILLIGVLHYVTHTEQVWVHNVLRRLYYLPIVFAAFQLGLRGGLLAAAVVSLTYAPHAFLHLGPLAHTDPAGNTDKLMELLLYNAVAVVAGVLSDRDLRRRAALQAALLEQQRLQGRLVRAGRLAALGEVVAGVAHEVKNPLHALKGTAEIIAPVIPAGSDEERFWKIHLSELDRLERVADRFLSFASPRTSAAEPLDLRAVAQRLVELVAAAARKQGIRVEASLPDAPAMVKGDRDQLAQVGLNIALNAMRAIGNARGLIRVVVDTQRDQQSTWQRLRIENDGPPLREPNVERLFDPFHGTDGEGTGLGLSISARLVEQHGGYIEAANGGLGVMFTVHLPAA